jgi:isocitrate dehydrogenase kinase/phosphatase
MPATLVEITEEQFKPEAREQRLNEQLTEASRVLQGDAHEQRWQQWANVAQAQRKLTIYWEHRARKAERQLRAMLRPELTDEQRAAILSTLRIDRSRNRLLLSDYEQQIVDQYRRMNAKGTTMVRELFAILSAANDDGKEGA